MKNTWIFQSAPHEFRLSALFNSKPESHLWKATQNADEMNIGDVVYIWQATGKGQQRAPTQSGVLGRGHISSEPKVIPDKEPGSHYWIDPASAAKAECRVEVVLEHVSTSPILDRDLVERTGVLRDARIFRSRTGTNFLLPPPQADALDRLWKSRLNP